jgi:hypothetical protein
MGKLLQRVSIEMLSVSNKRLLGAELLAVVEQIFAEFPTSGAKPARFKELTEIVQKRTKMNIEVAYNDYPICNACAYVPSLEGHNGTTYVTGTTPLNIRDKKIDYGLFDLHIDLEQGTISGELVDKLPMKIEMFAGLFSGEEVEGTPREVTGILLHEIGHCQNMYVACGDYVWLNYMLTEGVEVLLGKKPNVYKLQMLNETYFEKNVSDSKLREELRSAPTEENMRRAILTNWRLMPRHHLTSTGDYELSIKRDEQMADLYASRQGFGRDLVTYFNKLDRRYGAGSYTRGRVAFAVAETAKLIMGTVGVLLLPLWPISLPCLITVAILANGDHERYDNPTERINKTRKDLIAQLKWAEGDANFKAKLLEDIAVIDGVLKEYNSNRTAWDAIAQTLFHSSRRQAQLKKHEERLEGLLNNDAFLMAERFGSLT